MLSRIHKNLTVQSEVRKEFYRRLFYFGIGIIPLILVWDIKGEPGLRGLIGIPGIYRLFGLIGFIFAFYQLIILIATSWSIVDDFFPPKIRVDTRPSAFNTFMYYFSSLFFFTGLIFEVFEIRIIDNTIHGTRMFWMYSLFGIILAAILTFILKKINPSVYHESKRRFTVHAGLFLGFFLWAPATASFINHTFADNSVQCNSYNIQRKSTGGKNQHSSYLFLNIDMGNVERFDISRDLYNNVNEGEMVELCTKSGKLGYAVVESFNSVK